MIKFDDPSFLLRISFVGFVSTIQSEIILRGVNWAQLLILTTCLDLYLLDFNVRWLEDRDPIWGLKQPSEGLHYVYQTNDGAFFKSE